MALGEPTEPTDGMLEDFLACSEVPGVRFVGRIQRGAPAAKILDEVSRAGCDLIMMGTRGEGRGTPTGSVTAEVVRRAPCSVLVVPPAAALGQAIAEAVAEELEPRVQAS